MKLLIMHLLQTSLLGLNNLNTLFTNTFSLCSPLNARDNVTHPYKFTSKIYSFVYLSFKFLESRREYKRFW
jgi:hypothetical protein